MAVGSGTLLKPATATTLQTSQRLASASTDYGLGWKLETVSLAGERRANGEPLGILLAARHRS